ncbi:efflux RND transporter periplasmic adaptor subunit [Pseudomonas sp. BN417]|uniref:efflux RND transporter periplasmic adaptor subunit n=1 Tax=Pseudomonas sp. BN417 TaxID=2567890 RepID=UPI0024542BB9|nr:efflux RND transporter periplasmic adaptor subunit [Pseudomonas sp. BN417]MDH4555630.1 efflux RND transporter periplasmic adaptor subunit [Pseudomonas sp. BN417]
MITLSQYKRISTREIRSLACNKIPAFALLATMSLVLSACKEGAADTAVPAAAPTVDVARVVHKETLQWNEFNGRIAATDAVEIRPRVSGYIRQIAFEEGSEVKRGDLLFEIDPRPFEAELNSALARLENAEAAFMLAKAQDQRAQRLLPTSAISKDLADTKRTALLQSEAAVREAKAAVAVAKLNVEFTKVRAPIDGKVSNALLTLGNLAVADQSVLTRVVSINPIYVYFDPDERSFLNYAQVSQDSDNTELHVRVGLANEEGFPHSGTADFLDNVLDPQTGTIRVRATLDNSHRKFTPGLFARVQLANIEKTDAILVNDKAILTDQNKKYVYVLTEENKVSRKDIILGGLTDEGLRIVAKGLTKEDRVVVNGLHRVPPSGAAVTPVEVTM